MPRDAAQAETADREGLAVGDQAGKALRWRRIEFPCVRFLLRPAAMDHALRASSSSALP